MGDRGPTGTRTPTTSLQNSRATINTISPCAEEEY